MSCNRFLLTAVATALGLSASSAWAWDSICYEFTDPSMPSSFLTAAQVKDGSRNCEGPNAARGRMRDPVRKVDEHRQIMALTISRLGLPATMLDTYTLSVLTSREITVPGKDGILALPSLTPIAAWGSLEEAANFSGVQRHFSLDEMAQLPDTSYALWDWASGNENCPLPIEPPYNSTWDCHGFSKHMGATNANHWPPQADMWFDHYHQLALDSAYQCTTTRMLVRQRATQLGESIESVDARLKDTYKACEVEALTYEMIAQHYLQDVWSAGHMWGHWGSPDVTQFPDIQARMTPLGGAPLIDKWNGLPVNVRKLLAAQAIGVVVGSIHGIDPPFIDLPWLNMPADPMGYPHEGTTAVEWPHVESGTGFRIVGDLNLHVLPANFPDTPTHADVYGNDAFGTPYYLHPDLSMDLYPQASKMLDCTSGALGAVYDALMPTDGVGWPAIGSPDRPWVKPPFNRDQCRGPMVTNLGFSIGVDMTEALVDPALWNAWSNWSNWFQRVSLLWKYRPGLPLRRSKFFVTKMSAQLAAWQWYGPLPFSVTDDLGWSYSRMFNLSMRNAERRPFGTDLAKEPPSILGVGPNSDYLTTAPLPGQSDAAAEESVLEHSGDPTTPAGKVALTFHRGRSAEFCYRAETFELIDSLGEMIRLTRRMPQSTPEEIKARTAAVQACAEWVAPFVWNKDSWIESVPDPLKHRYGQAPLCSYLPDYPPRGWIDPGRSGPHYSLADGTYLAGDWAAYPRRSQTDAFVAYDRSTAYQGGAANATPDELAKLMCGAKLNATNTGGFRIHGKVSNLHPDAFVGFFLRSSQAPALSSHTKIWAPQSGSFRPMFRRMGNLSLSQSPWIEDEDRVLVRVASPQDYDYVAIATDVDAPHTAREGQIAYRDPAASSGPEHIAHYAIHGGIRGLGDTHGGGGGGETSGDSEYYFNNSRTTLPANGEYVLQPLTPANGLQHCSFDPPSATLSLNANAAEAFDVDFTATCQSTNELTLTLSGAGRVFVSDASLACDAAGPNPTECRFWLLGSVTLTAAGANPVAWGGACSGTSPSCTLTMDAAKVVTAGF